MSDLDEQQKIVAKFQKLREEQQNIVGEISRIEEERREYSRVLNLLKDLDGSRTCHRLVSDSLVEFTVGDVVPILDNNLQNLEKVRDKLNEALVEKGNELVAHKEKHNIRFLSDQEVMSLRQKEMAANAQKTT